MINTAMDHICKQIWYFLGFSQPSISKTLNWPLKVHLETTLAKSGLDLMLILLL